ncbi:transcription factor GTE8-like [Cornus florida]|uniref:transcription factor GTE8-like n=1 Tax=Cornus florida TaxID=4283 RepID=UPI002898C433|nr:transcription factor GTE8-like [Cornus florida]XP_059669354.1 transcription factor GTE8-like [Cornus florida]
MFAAETIVMRKLRIKTESKQTKTESTTRCNFGQQAVLKVKLSEPGCHMRRPPGLVESQKVKRQKIDQSVSQQCSTILKKLTTNPSAWPFNQPVDPDKLNIPDYFSIVSEPMDLGTIKTKLEKNLYSSAEEFASDVKLTFSNAMLYNPPDNYVHLMAKDLDNMFNSGWKCLEAKWNCKSKRDEQMFISSERPKNIDVLGQNRSSLEIRAAKAEPTKMKGNGRFQSSGKMFHNGMKWQNTISVTGTRSASGSNNIKPSLAVSKCACGSVRCQCGRQNDFVCSSSSDLSSEKSLEQDHHDACRTDCEVQMSTSSLMSTSSQMSKSDSDGAASALDEEKFCSSPQLSTLATTSASGEACTPLIDVQLSPKKALRHAMLKSRFADTILRAEQKGHLNHGGKADVLKMRQEKEKMKRMQHEEVLRIQAEIKAAEAASRLRAKAELKMQLEREREAARLELEKIEKSVEIDENLKIFKELEMLCGCSPFGRFCNALEQLGLYIKEEYLVGENEDIYS